MPQDLKSLIKKLAPEKEYLDSAAILEEKWEDKYYRQGKNDTIDQFLKNLEASQELEGWVKVEEIRGLIEARRAKDERNNPPFPPNSSPFAPERGRIET